MQYESKGGEYVAFEEGWWTAIRDSDLGGIHSGGEREVRPGHVKIDPRRGSDRDVPRSVVDLPERGDS